MAEGAGCADGTAVRCAAGTCAPAAPLQQSNPPAVKNTKPRDFNKLVENIEDTMRRLLVRCILTPEQVYEAGKIGWEAPWVEEERKTTGHISVSGT